MALTHRAFEPFGDVIEFDGARQTPDANLGRFYFRGVQCSCAAPIV
jgi:ureidoglycolate hydrolase